PGSQPLPRELDNLKRVPNRQPWQITRRVTFPKLQSNRASTNVILQAIPDIKDEQGLAAYTLTMRPNCSIRAPDPCQGGAQYLLVVNVNLLHDKKDHTALSLVFIYPEDAPFDVHAGSPGLEALILNFPRCGERREVSALNARAGTEFKSWS